MVFEETCIDGIDCSNVSDVLQEDIDFNHIVQAVADAFDDGLDIGKALLGLCSDITGNEDRGIRVDR